MVDVGFMEIAVIVVFLAVILIALFGVIFVAVLAARRFERRRTEAISEQPTQ